MFVKPSPDQYCIPPMWVNIYNMLSSESHVLVQEEDIISCHGVHHWHYSDLTWISRLMLSQITGNLTVCSTDHSGGHEKKSHEHRSIWNHQKLDCVFNTLFWLTTKKISKVHIIVPLWQESTGNLQFHIFWWRQYDFVIYFTFKE